MERPPALRSAAARDDERLAPERDAALLAAHCVDAPLEVAAWLRILRERAVPLALFHRAWPLPAPSRVIAVHSPVDRIALAVDVRTTIRVDLAAGAIAVALVDRVKLQFDTGPLLPDLEADEPCLRARMPAGISRLQRRDAFRVPLRAPRAARCTLEAWRIDAPSHPVSDLGAGGLSLVLPASTLGDRPPPGTRWQDCLLELPGVAAIRCALLLVHAEATEGGGWRLGLRFERLSPQEQRDVQRYVIAVQRQG